MDRGALRHLPNVISGARLVAAPILVVLAVNGSETAFSWLLIGALISDVADGLVARALALQSRLGAMLDSAADVTTLISAAYGINVFHPVVLREHAIGVALVLGGWLLVCVLALFRYRRLSSFHTYASKAAGYALGFFLAVLFLVGFSAPSFYVAVALSAFASIEELALLWHLPAWRSDVRGLWWILRERSA
jgi:CDP-diacylglycerol--glycerol-3-phosphate 3-phosphatidyltransferase